MSVISVAIAGPRAVTCPPRGHAARVDGRRDPVRAALRHGCAGLTVGVRLDARGRLIQAGSAATVRASILDPLSVRVGRTGQVNAGARDPFTVVLEAGAGCAVQDVLDVLDDELAGYGSMLAGCVGNDLRLRPVAVLLAGVPWPTVALRADRLYFAEGTLSDVDTSAPTEAVPMVGEHVAWRLGWDARGEIAAEERHLLRALVRAAHSEGKRVRFFGVPERPRHVRTAFWHELYTAGADLIGAGDLGALRRFLHRRSAGLPRRVVE